jgi:hypothetical protein
MLFEYIGFLDADLSVSFDEFQRMLVYSKIENKKIVFGSRVKRMGAKIERSPIRHVVGRVFATLIAWTIKFPFYDTQCGAKVFHVSVIETITQSSFITKWLFDVEIIIRLKQFLGEEGMYNSLIEYPLFGWTEVKGSKLNWKDFYKIPIDLVRIRIKYKN